MRFGVLISCAVLGLLVSGTASAERVSGIEPGNRLQKGTAGGEQGSNNVSVQQISPADLPEKIQTFVVSKVLACTGNAQLAVSVHAYAWVSDWNRSKSYPPNYIIDFRPLSAVPSSACKPEPVCADAGCLVQGYAAVEDGEWREGFSVRATDFQFVNLTERGASTSVIGMQVLSNKSSCEGGAETKQGCLRRFTWRNVGLTYVQMPEK